MERLLAVVVELRGAVERAARAVRDLDVALAELVDLTEEGR